MKLFCFKKFGKYRVRKLLRFKKLLYFAEYCNHKSIGSSEELDSKLINKLRTLTWLGHEQWMSTCEHWAVNINFNLSCKNTEKYKKFYIFCISVQMSYRNKQPYLTFLAT